MRKTYCKAHMTFVDVTALADSIPSSASNQDIADITLLKDKVAAQDYGTLELNQFILDGTKQIIAESTNDIVYMSDSMSDEECLFTENPVIVFEFTQNHTSAGITLDFGYGYPAEITVTWYTLKNEKLIAKTFYPDATTFVCRNQVENYGKITVEFVKTRLPYQYARLQSILFGIELEWNGSTLQSAKITENVDVTSSTLAINTASISIIDKNNDFDIENDDGAWKAVQKSQEVTLSEYINGELIPCGIFFIDEKSFSKNIASFTLIDRIGLMDNYIFDQGEMYSDKKIGEIIESIFACANVTEYEIENDVYNTKVSGTLGIQTCREALQMCCFVVGALADDSRSGIIKISNPGRYIKHTIPTSRKFDGNTSVELKEYVSGISISSVQYELAQDTENIYDDVLPIGRTRIEFSDPYKPETISASVGTIVEARTHYLVVEMSESGKCTITGRKYDKKGFKTVIKDAQIEANETENVKEFGDFTLYNADVLAVTAKKLLDYYKLRKQIKLKYILDKEQVGDWVAIYNVKGMTSMSLIENQDIDLTGGFLSTASCCGYSVVVTDYAFAGTELYAGGNVL